MVTRGVQLRRMGQGWFLVSVIALLLALAALSGGGGSIANASPAVGGERADSALDGDLGVV